MGLGTLSMLFVFTVLIVPLMQSLALLWQWYKPSTGDEKIKMSIIIEILQAWQYAEVYLIAIFVASWQLGPISEFMINSYCGSLKDTLGELVYYGILKAEDAQCFSVESTINGGSYILAIGAILLSIATTFVNKAIVQYFRDVRNEERLQNGNAWDSESDAESGYQNTTSTRVQPVPVLFTDTFRWLMVRVDHRRCSNSFLSAFGKFSRASRESSVPSAPLTEGNSSGSDMESAEGGSVLSNSNHQTITEHFDDESGYSSVDQESTQNATP
jgi:hypothetical protein